MEREEHVVGGRYRIERVLGEGGMGLVLQALDQSTGRQLALKRLRAGLSHPELFEREYQTLASLRHPRIVRVFEYGVDEQGPFYTMELLEGSDLSGHAPMAWRDVCACLRDLASILGVLHARRWVHRDLSPRNLWRSSDGRLKLIDFGALAPFGATHEIVGTLAFIAPEVVGGRELDQRTDLFALGALAFWLLTGRHAYQATQLGELTSAWRRPPLPASSVAKLVPGGDPDVPAELDRLIDALLRVDVDERPRNTADVVDQLNAIAGLKPEAQDVVVQGYLDSTAFVGRDRELASFAALIPAAMRGEPQLLLVAGPEGSGRSRMLEECGLAARLWGATVVTAGVTDSRVSYAAAIALARALVKASPQALAGLSREARAVLGSLAPDMMLGSSAKVAADGADDRTRKQSAFLELFLEFSAQRPLLLAVDDLQQIDEESRAIVATLARTPSGHRLYCLVSVRTGQKDSSALHGLPHGTAKLLLPPLTAAEVRDVLRSIFGEVPYLERAAVRLHRLAVGNPRVLLLLVRHLVRSGAARYRDGTWVLPSELPEELPATLDAGVVAELEGLPATARRLAQLLSLSDYGSLPRDLLPLLAECSAAECKTAVEALLERRILHESNEGVRLTHRALVAQLRAELPGPTRQRAHASLCELLSRSQDPLSQGRAALHALHAGAGARASVQLFALSRRIMAGEHAALGVVASMYEEALPLLRHAGDPADTTVAVLSVLAVAGYQVDRSYALRYGDAALDALQRCLRFDIAQRVKPYLGGRGALAAAMAAATAGMLRRRSGLQTIETIRWLVAVLGYLMGPAALCVDGPKLRRYAALFEPLLALGREHGVALAHRFCLGLAASTEDRSGAARALQQPVIDRLLRPEPVPGLTDQNRRNMLAAALYADGIRQTLACDAGALNTADRLATFSPMHEMQADHLRALYHSHRGELETAAQFERRVELQAIQLGRAWQAELLTPRHQMRLVGWTYDLANNRRAARALSELAQEIPSFAICAQRARSADLVLRGRHAEALPELERPEAPMTNAGWVFARSLLASVYRERGEPERARAVCADVLAHLTAEDRSFVISNLSIEIELALADAALGSTEQANQRLDRLLGQHAGAGALIVGGLHHARARAALYAQDFVTAQQQLEATESCYRSTRLPSLFLVSAELRAALQRALRPEGPGPLAALGGDARLLAQLELVVRAGAEPSEHNRALLQIALDLVNADRGFVVMAGSSQPSAWAGAAASNEAIAWACERLTTLEHDDDQTLVGSALDAPADDENVRVIDGEHHRLIALWTSAAESQSGLAVIVVASRAAPPLLPPTTMLQLLVSQFKARAATARSSAAS